MDPRTGQPPFLVWRDCAVDQLLRFFDPIFVWTVLLPMGVILAAWGLQFACSFCSVDPPDFWQALLAVIVICIANVVMRFWLQVNQNTVEIETQFVASLLTTAVVLTLSLQTNPLAATVVSVVHFMFYSAFYLAVTLVGSAV